MSLFARSESNSQKQACLFTLPMYTRLFGCVCGAGSVWGECGRGNESQKEQETKRVSKRNRDGPPRRKQHGGLIYYEMRPRNSYCPPFPYRPNNSNISEGLPPNHLAPVSKSTGAHCQKHRRTSAVVPLTGSTVQTCLRMAGKAYCLSLA